MRSSKRAIVALISTTIIMGASVASFGVEMTLAGIKLGNASQTVLKRFGNPTRITIGAVSVGTGPAVQNRFNQPAAPGGAGNPFAPIAAMANTYNSYANEALGGSPEGGAPVLPGLPGLGMPSAPTSATGAPVQNVLTEEQVTWTYDLSDGTTIEFIVAANGKIVQITVGGERPYALSKTTRGIKLGASYKDVIFRYGYPEGQSYAGRFLRLSYADKQRCVFTLLNKKVVGVTIALQSQ